MTDDEKSIKSRLSSSNSFIVPDLPIFANIFEKITRLIFLFPNLSSKLEIFFEHKSLIFYFILKNSDGKSLYKSAQQSISPNLWSLSFLCDSDFLNAINLIDFDSKTICHLNLCVEVDNNEFIINEFILDFNKLYYIGSEIKLLMITTYPPFLFEMQNGSYCSTIPNITSSIKSSPFLKKPKQSSHDDKNEIQTISTISYSYSSLSRLIMQIKKYKDCQVCLKEFEDLSKDQVELSTGVNDLKMHEILQLISWKSSFQSVFFNKYLTLKRIHDKYLTIVKDRASKVYHNNEIIENILKVDQLMEMSKIRISQNKSKLRESNNELKRIRMQYIHENIKIFAMYSENLPIHLELLNSIHILCNLSKILSLELPFPIRFKNTSTYIEDRITSRTPKLIEFYSDREPDNYDKSIIPYLETNMSLVFKTLGIEITPTIVWDFSTKIKKITFQAPKNTFINGSNSTDSITDHSSQNLQSDTNYSSDTQRIISMSLIDIIKYFKSR